MPRRSRSSNSDTAMDTSLSPTRSPPPKRYRTRSYSRRLRDLALGGEDQEGRRLRVTDEDFHDRNAILRTVTAPEGLKAESVDLNITANRKEHHTDEYEHKKLIIRRGQAFNLVITFNHPVNIDKDQIILQFAIGPRAQESKGTLIRLPLSATAPAKRQGWHAAQDGVEKKQVKVTVTPSADAIIGNYNFFVETHTKDTDKEKTSSRIDFPDEVTVIFNPWCKDDMVYMENNWHKKEYVLNEAGRLFCGSARCPGGRPWNHGQFEDVCLDAALYLLDKAELAYGARSNPIHVTRTLSQMSNSNDADGGVLTGRWTKEYPKNSTEPWAWIGSVAILEEFMKTKRAVRFGQCWVFSGLVTTLMRSIGIPTRSITNFESAHDSDASMTIDFHWNEKDEPLDHLNDSVWNFHVWNESWFKRPDLPDGYDGWQAHDATPQELSEGVMRCGPAPVKAIKDGHVYIPYDAPFIFAEVNGDRVNWLVKDDGTYKCLNKERYSVGQRISTKAVGTLFREDVTSQYKYREFSDDERNAVHRAFCHSTRKEMEVYDVDEPDVTFELDIPECVMIGSPLEIRVKMTNKVDAARKVRGRLSANACYYTGVPSDRLGSHEFEETIKAKSDRELVLHIKPADYMHLIKPESMVKVYLKGTVLDNKRSYARQDSFTFTKPTLDIEAPESCYLLDPFDVTIKFRNPLSEKITGAVFHIEAAGITKSMKINHKKAIGPGDEITETVSLLARRCGYREILVSLSSDQVAGMNGTALVRIKYPE